MQKLEPDNSPEFQQIEKRDGGFFGGAGIGCLVQTLFLAVGFVVAKAENGELDGMVIWLCAWGFLQWLVLIPVILYYRRRGSRRAMAGMITVGGLGLLLSSACASLVLHR